MKIFLVYLLFINILTFAAMSIDKRKAKKKSTSILRINLFITIRKMICVIISMI